MIIELLLMIIDNDDEIIFLKFQKMKDENGLKNGRKHGINNNMD